MSELTFCDRVLQLKYTWKTLAHVIARSRRRRGNLSSVNLVLITQKKSVIPPGSSRRDRSSF
ncbi:MAG: hypothetical protein ACP5LD_15205, partial [Desulfomonilaceae bacterium]